MQALLLLVLTFLGLSAAAVSYAGYKVFKITPDNREQMEALKFVEKDSNFDFWSPINRANKPVTVMVPPKMQTNFIGYLHRHSINFRIEIDDVERIIRAERLQIRHRPQLKLGKISFNQYYRHFEMETYLQRLANDYPKLVRTEIIGKSYEGRNITLIHISRGGNNKPTIFIDAGIHAREWIAPAVALYVINQLVENATNHHLIDDVNWTILPNLNPDGYEFTWDEDRMWRKTRSHGQICDGTDANRNFDFHWMDIGASDWECDETYAGPKPFSEKEAQALRDYLLNATTVEDVVLYLTLHSYGQYLLYPWGYGDELPDNWKELDKLGNDVNDAIKAVRGTEYTVGSSATVLYPASGASDDWSMGIANVPLVYTVELPGGGSEGFDLPATEIQGVCEETWQGFLVYHNYVVDNYKKH